MKYRYHWLFKLTAFLMAVISGAMLVLGGVGLLLEEGGYYYDARRGYLYQQLTAYCDRATKAVFDWYAWEGTGIDPKLFSRFFRWGADVDAMEELEYGIYYEIYDDYDGKLLTGNKLPGMDYEWSGGSTFDVRRGYVTEMPKAEHYPTYEDMYRSSALTYIDLTGEPLPALGEGVTDIEYYVVSEDSSVNPQNISMDSYDHSMANGADYTIYRMEYTGYEDYWVEVGLSAEQVARMPAADLEAEFIPRFLAEHRELFGPMVIWGGLVLLMSVLWLALVAGSSPKSEDVCPGGLNRIPLDLYLVGAVLGCCCLAAAGFEWMESMIFSSGWGNYDGVGGTETFLLETSLLALCGGGIGGILALLFMAVAAQMKTGNGYWLKHTSVGICWRYGWKYGKITVIWCWNLLKKCVRRVRSLFAALGRFFRRFLDLLPLSWQWLAVSGALWLLMLILCLVAYEHWSVLPILLGALLTAGPVVYGAYCFGRLRDAAKKMSGGSLEEKIENKYLLGCFGEFAGHLNALGDTCIEAARQQMKSERMKSELVTNVSHDIKTPLTSIINYVDLLQKTDDEAEKREYLEVLDRQSQKLKKLIEDLMEMSRANSGNVAVEITPTDVCEAVNQALGEFSDNLDRCGLTVLQKMPAEPCMALCDGRHLWRVLGNCLSNVVKYAMPGTRVYVEVAKRGQKVEISLKNISANMLNITAEELMERFVRGDASRNTEGNGLGLNIARSLMELQGGRMELLVDGDLFKVVLTLNTANE